MTYRLFIDDERIANLAEDESMVIVRNYEEAVEVMASLGCPYYVSFDHDLGDNIPSGHEIAKWMVEQDINLEGEFFPEDFEFHIHSQNPIGKKNIEGTFSGYFRYLEMADPNYGD